MSKSIIYLILKNLRENVLFRANKAGRKSLIKTFLGNKLLCPHRSLQPRQLCISPPSPLINDEGV